MYLLLDHQQRLNLIALLDGVECKGVREIFAIYRLQESLDLTESEKASIDLVEETSPEGQRMVRWNTQKMLQPRTFELSADDGGRLKRAIENWQGQAVPAQLRWLKSLWPQIETNGEVTSAVTG